MQTIIEVNEYIKQASKLLDESEQNNIISYLASFPESGDIIQGTGGYVSIDGLLKVREKVAVYE